MNRLQFFMMVIITIIFTACSGGRIDYSKYLLLYNGSFPYDEVFNFVPNQDLESSRYSNVNDIVINDDGYMETVTGTDGTASITSPRFKTMKRTRNGGIVVEWKIKWLADAGSSYAERNKFWVRLQDKSGANVYTVHWKPLPNAADRNRANRFLQDGADNDLVLGDDQKELLVYPIGSSALWVSFRMEIDDAGVRVYNDLTADSSTTDGNPDWSVITPEIEVAHTDGTSISKITFEYRHLPDYSILVRDFFIAYLSDMP